MSIRIRDMERPAGLPPMVPCEVTVAERSAVAGLVAMVEGNPLFAGQLVMSEEQERCFRAVAEARRLIAETTELLPPDAVAQDLLAAMRSACRKYMTEAEGWDRRSGRRFCMPSFAFFQLLGAFRELMGLYVWRLGEEYDLEIEGRLTTIFPGIRE